MPTAQSRPDFTLQIRRTFAAPREKVFAAWTEPHQLEKWMCRDVAAHTVIHHRQDIRTGGRYLLEVRDSAKGKATGARASTWKWTRRKGFGSPGPGPRIARTGRTCTRRLQSPKSKWNSWSGTPQPRWFSPIPVSLMPSSARSTTAAGTAASMY